MRVTSQPRREGRGTGEGNSHGRAPSRKDRWKARWKPRGRRRGLPRAQGLGEIPTKSGWAVRTPIGAGLPGLLRGRALTPSKKGCPASHVPGDSVPGRLFPLGFSGTGCPSGRLLPTPDAPRPAPGPTLRVRWLCNLHQLRERCQPTGFTRCTALKPIS